MPFSQARENTSGSQFRGQPNAEPPICVSVLKELSTSHSSGSTISTAHTTRKPCEKTFSTTPSPRRSPGRTVPLVTGGGGGVGPPVGAVSLRGALIVVTPPQNS